MKTNSLYRILFVHYSQKDSKKGIATYVFAQSDEAIYEWLKSDPKIGKDYDPCISGSLLTCWSDHEEDDSEFKERIIECKGRMFDDEYEPTDLYYGDTEYGWEWISDVSDELKQSMIELNIAISL